MNSPVFKWLCQLEQEGIIKELDLGAYSHHRLCTPVKIHIAEDFVKRLRTDYTPRTEKGGVLLFEITKHGNEVFLILKDIRFLVNISEYPEYSYLPNRIELLQVCEYALNNKLLPCIFHSHPTEDSNYIMEAYNYIGQMGTSEADMAASLEPVPCDGFLLRLPEFLVVCNGRLNTGIFIGVYGGLIAPLSFEKEKSEIADRFLERIHNNIVNYFDTPRKQFFGVLGLVTAVGLSIKYPKTAATLVATTAGVLPPVIWETEGNGNFFRVSTHGSINIDIPTLSEDDIIAEEKNQRERLRYLRDAKKRNN